MAAIVDSNILIDIAYRDPVWANWSRQALVNHFEGGLVINPVIIAEFSLRFREAAEMQAAIDRLKLVAENLPCECALAAGQAFRVYRSRGGARMATLPDFFIGAHATFCGYSIITRDPSGYRTYFPHVPLIAPDTHP